MKTGQPTIKVNFTTSSKESVSWPLINVAEVCPLPVSTELPEHDAATTVCHSEWCLQSYLKFKVIATQSFCKMLGSSLVRKAGYTFQI